VHQRYRDRANERERGRERERDVATEVNQSLVHPYELLDFALPFVHRPPFVLNVAIDVQQPERMGCDELGRGQLPRL
jgi:hypothetical protein